MKFFIFFNKWICKILFKEDIKLKKMVVIMLLLNLMFFFKNIEI